MAPPPSPAADAALLAAFHARTPHTILGALGVEVTAFDAERCVVEVDVSERLFQHAGIVHGGVYVLLAETAASTAAALGVDLSLFRVAGQEISASHVRAATTGRLRAVAVPVHRGRSSHVYAVDVDNDGTLVSTCRCTIAVRPVRTGVAPP